MNTISRLVILYGIIFTGINTAFQCNSQCTTDQEITSHNQVIHKESLLDQEIINDKIIKVDGTEIPSYDTRQDISENSQVTLTTGTENHTGGFKLEGNNTISLDGPTKSTLGGLIINGNNTIGTGVLIKIISV